MLMRGESGVSKCSGIVGVETAREGIFELRALIVLFIFKIVFVNVKQVKGGVRF